MKDIFLVRHGRQCSTRCNVDVSLDDTGRRQAALAAERLSRYGLEKLYASGLKRAVETADIIGDRIGLTPVVIEEFREIDFGVLTGRVDTEVRSEYAEFQRERAQQTSDLRYPGGENGSDVVARVMPRIEQLCQAAERRVAVVTHGGVIRALCAHLLQTDLKHKLKFAINLENTSITQICYDEGSGRFYLERFNDAAHLEQEPELLRKSWNTSWLCRES